MHQKPTGRYPETKKYENAWLKSDRNQRNGQAVTFAGLMLWVWMHPNLLGRVLVYTCHTEVNIHSSLFALENGFVYMANYLVTLKTQKFNVTSDWQLILLFLILQNLVVFTVSKTEPSYSSTDSRLFQSHLGGPGWTGHWTEEGK